jgi:hypothetical protein
MDVIEVLPRSRFIRLPGGHRCLSRDADGLILIDTARTGPRRPSVRGRMKRRHRPCSARSSRFADCSSPCPPQRFEGSSKHLPQPLIFFSKQA